MAEPLDTFPDFTTAVVQRLQAGRVSYGDRSFALPPFDLLGEIEEELLDVCGWAFILWTRLQAISPRLQGSESPGALPADPGGAGRTGEAS